MEMQGDVAAHLHREVLSLPVFGGASQGCLNAIAMQIKPMFCAPGEYVIHKGDAIVCIYFVTNGSLEVLKDSMVVAILGRSTVYDLCHRPNGHSISLIQSCAFITKVPTNKYADRVKQFN